MSSQMFLFDLELYNGTKEQLQADQAWWLPGRPTKEEKGGGFSAQFSAAAAAMNPFSENR